MNPWHYPCLSGNTLASALINGTILAYKEELYTYLLESAVWERGANIKAEMSATLL